MTPVFEFVGGPWDGETKVIHEGNEIHIHMASTAGQAMIVTDLVQYVEPRIGVYKRVRRRDAPPQGYFKWMGEL